MQWFLKKRGLATGIALSGSGFGGGIASLLLRGILPSLGYRNALLVRFSLSLVPTYIERALDWKFYYLLHGQVYAGINAVVWIAACFLLEMRTAPLRPGETRLPKNWLPLGVWSDVAFYSLVRTCFSHHIRNKYSGLRVIRCCVSLSEYLDISPLTTSWQRTRNSKSRRWNPRVLRQLYH